jgi:adenylate cyclase
MGKEIERKFLVKDDTFKKLARGTKYRQGYLNSTKERVVRVRTIDDKGFLTVKEIPAKDADAMLDELCEKPIIEKNRYKIQNGNLVWEIDEFFGENQGLIVAEVELESEEQSYGKPGWIGAEVTGDPKYFNSNLIQNPYKNW